MKEYSIDLRNASKEIYSGHIPLGGANPEGDRIGFSNYYMTLNGKPFFGICGEFHYSRFDERFWKDEIVKMKMCGINIIATYIFWIHHEEEQGIFEWGGGRNLRRFIELCGKHGLYVIIRIGPFSHGEVRNGGIPDWLFGRPFDIRSNDEGYLFFVRRFYNEIGKQVKDLLYKDGGPVIGTQIENEYMHAGAPLELTTGVSNEWLPAGRDGKEHMKRLKQIAMESGIDTPVYTCTAWGGAAAPEDEMLPLWGGYAFWPWIFYGDIKEHPATPEYIFRDYHNNHTPKCYNFEPGYPPESYPYACCEMGGGMTVFYKYRFRLPPESVEAMALVKAAGGCNFVGYYMFHGGSNPAGKHTTYLNEHAVPKISYDFQAPIGEYGQIREHYKRLKLLHYFFKDFEITLCPMKTVIPGDTVQTDPYDIETLRYAARVKDGSGFLFINNYQDHLEMKEQKDFCIHLELDNEKLAVPENGTMTLAKGACCILPFNLDLDGAYLKYSTTQLITKTEVHGEKYYFFFIPEGLKGEYCFNPDGICDVHVEQGTAEKSPERMVIKVDESCMSLITLTTERGNKVHVCTLAREQSLNLWKVDLWGRERLILSDANLMAADGELKLECVDRTNVTLALFPRVEGNIAITGAEMKETAACGIFTGYCLSLSSKKIVPQLERVKKPKAVLKLENDAFEGLGEILLKVDYTGDVGYAFIDGKLVNDNFCNGTPWEIGLKRYKEELLEKGMYIYISPLKKGARIKSDSVMAARMEFSEVEIAEIFSVKAVPVYEVRLSLRP